MSGLPVRPPAGLPLRPLASPEGDWLRPPPAKRHKKKHKPLGDYVAELPLQTPWIIPMTEYESKEQRLHDEIVVFVQYISPTPAERAVQQKLIDRLTELVRGRLRDCDVRLFGSVAQDLSLPGGDLDISIRLPQATSDEDCKNRLFQISKILRDNGFSEKSFVNTYARVPILTLETGAALGSAKFDININSDDGVTATPMIKHYLDTMPALRPLIMVLKAFLTARSLNSAALGGLGSYALSLIAISFLQINPGGRPLEYLEKPMEYESLGVLLMDFLDYYHDKFPYETSYISVSQQGVFPKDDKNWRNETRPEALSIESIINPDIDVGKSCDKIRAVRSAFGEALTTLQAYTLSPSKGNILGSILGISGKTVEHRRYLEEIINNGSLDRALGNVTSPSGWNTKSYHAGGNAGPHAGVNQSTSSNQRNGQYGQHTGTYGGDQTGARRDQPPHLGNHANANGNHYGPYRPYNSGRCPW